MLDRRSPDRKPIPCRGLSPLSAGRRLFSPPLHFGLSVWMRWGGACASVVRFQSDRLWKTVPDSVGRGIADDVCPSTTSEKLKADEGL